MKVADSCTKRTKSSQDLSVLFGAVVVLGPYVVTMTVVTDTQSL